MKNVTLNALVRIPESTYFDFNNGLNGVANIDSITKDGETYTANFSFLAGNLGACLKVMKAIDGLDVIDSEAENNNAKEARSSHYMNGKGRKSGKSLKGRSPRAGRSGPTMIEQLRETLASNGGFMNTAQLAGAMGWSPKYTSPRIAELAKKNKISKKKIDGVTCYRLDQ